MRLKVVNQLNSFTQETCVGVLLLSLLVISFPQISRATEVLNAQTITTRHNNKRRNLTSDVTSSSSLPLAPPLPLSPPSSILPFLPVRSSSSTFEQQVLKG